MRKRGRPRKVESGHVPGTPPAKGGVNGGSPGGALAVTAIAPRLLDLEAAALYLGVSSWTVRELANKKDGVLKRVRIPLKNNGELRKVLFDREDLDRLIEKWKEKS